MQMCHLPFFEPCLRPCTDFTWACCIGLRSSSCHASHMGSGMEPRWLPSGARKRVQNWAWLADLAACQKAAPPILEAFLRCPAAATNEEGEPRVHLTHGPALARAQALAAAAPLNLEQSRCPQHAACWLSSQDQDQVSQAPVYLACRCDTQSRAHHVDVTFFT